MSAHRYTQAERDAIYKVIRERRDMRHFIPGPIDPAVLQRLLQAAHHAPSVGLMQPWRFIQVKDSARREALHRCVEAERQRTAAALGEQQDQFLRLKVQGILDCAEVLVAALPDGREKYIFGRRTMPEMDLASVACAIQNMWLAARAEGIGLGWVSIYDPQELKALLGMPADSHPIAILCLGHVADFYDEPMLVTEGWAMEAPLEQFLYQECWPDGDD